MVVARLHSAQVCRIETFGKIGAGTITAFENVVRFAFVIDLVARRYARVLVRIKCWKSVYARHHGVAVVGIPRIMILFTTRNAFYLIAKTISYGRFF